MSEKSNSSPTQVKLKPIFNIHPGKYLSILFATIILLLVFILLFLPGIVEQGSKYSFKSFPSGAAVRVDDVYMGYTPCNVFVPKGQRTITFVMSGFEKKEASVISKTDVLSHSIFSNTQSLEMSLEEKEPLAALLLGARDFAKWSFTGQPNNIYQIPMPLSLGAERTNLKTQNDQKRANDILEVSARFVSTKTALKDLLRAKWTIDNGIISPLCALYSLQSIISYMEQNPAFTVQVCDILGEKADFIMESDWFKANVSDAVFASKHSSKANFGGRISVGGLNFIQIQGGTFDFTPDFKFSADLPSYYMAETEITPSAFAAFLKENPYFDKSNTEKLIQEKLVTSDYLMEYDDPAFDTKEYALQCVAGISWYVAEAYCKWLSSKLPPAFAGYEVRLPNEIEWQYAASGADDSSGYPFKNMFNTNKPMQNNSSNAGMWEWCADPFVSIYFLQADSSTIEELGSPRRSVRGGAWINPPGTVSIETRAGLQPDSCSPFTAFRPIIAQRDSY
ncbi:MAG: SUMF1/EgtB/PvdO family nonheme iron enzyme [Termitinemataceae bacterium]|nr:MAG: SUMF1/EgtB/PvdO family nonheme iron enzyme [Termitinemataceae bacterium]